MDPVLIGIFTTIGGALAAAIGVLYKERSEERKRMQARIDKLETALEDAAKKYADKLEEQVQFALNLTDKVNDQHAKLGTMIEILDRRNGRSGSGYGGR